MRTTLSAWLRSGPGSRLGVRALAPVAACTKLYSQLYHAGVQVRRMDPVRLQLDGREVIFLGLQEPALGLALVDDASYLEPGI